MVLAHMSLCDISAFKMRFLSFSSVNKKNLLLKPVAMISGACIVWNFSLNIYNIITGIILNQYNFS